jgi:hypothetical protein
MNKKIRTFGLAAASLALALATVACGDPPLDPTPPETFSVSGTISEATEDGSAPLEGVSVMNRATGVVVITNADGYFALHGVVSGLGQFIASKEGYQNQNLELMVNADMRLDATLVREAETEEDAQ